MAEDAFGRSFLPIICRRYLIAQTSAAEIDSLYIDSKLSAYCTKCIQLFLRVDRNTLSSHIRAEHLIRSLRRLAHLISQF